MTRRVALLLCIIMVLMLGLFFATSCEKTDALADVPSYVIHATLDDYSLDINEKITYKNNENTPLTAIRIVSYVDAFTDSGNVANMSSALAYPFGVNYAEFAIQAVKVDGKIASISKHSNMYYDIALSKPLRSGKKVDIEIDYTETIPKNRLRYGYNDTSINLGNAFIKVASIEGGAFVDYPYSLSGDPFIDDISDFDVTIDVEDGLRASMTGGFVRDSKGNRNVYHSIAKSVRDYAIVLSDSMHSVSDTRDGVNVSYMSQDVMRTCSIDTAMKALEIMGRLFGKYPYDSLAIVENDFLEGGMEYPMLIYVNKDADDATREKVIIHEIAHQWWYGLVGVNENIDYFIDEGMAEFATYLYYLNAGESDYANALMKMASDDYLRYRLHHSEERMNIPLSNVNDLEYYVMAYLKAPLIYYEVMNEMGSDAFLGVIRRVVDKYRYGRVSIDEFVEEFGRYGDEMREYIKGKPLC